MAKKRSFIRLGDEQAKTLILARVLEEGKTLVDDTALEEATLTAARTESTAKAFLLARAQKILAAARTRGFEDPITEHRALTRSLFWLVALAAFFLGAATDRFTTGDHYVNLLSTAFWLVILWNLFVYLLMGLGAVGILESRGGPVSPRRLIRFINTFLGTLSPRAKGEKAKFLSAWHEFCAPQMLCGATRLLHFAAAAFALGMIASLALRGFATAYLAGWESTWLSDDPGAVHTLLKVLLGWVPAFLAGAPFPDVTTIAAMQSELLPYAKSGVPAAAWLIRMMVVMAAVVIVPRLLFVLYQSLKISRLKKNSKFFIDDPYFEALLANLTQAKVAAGPLHILTVGTVPEKDRATLEHLAEHWGKADQNTSQDLELTEETVLPDFSASTEARLVAVVMNGAKTPEPDLEGTFFTRALEKAGASGFSLVLLIAMSAYEERMASFAGRAAEREALWKSLAAGAGITAHTLTASTAELLEFMTGALTPGDVGIETETEGETLGSSDPATGGAK